MSGRVLKRDDVLELVAKARESGNRADLSYADLSYANLTRADLGYANLTRANLTSANLGYANLGYANLYAANLSYADLSYANLRAANLSCANLSRTMCLSVTGLPSGHAILIPMPEGWRLKVGCWSGTVAQLRELIAQDDGWPEAEGEQILVRRPMLAALADMADAWSDAHPEALAEVQSEWANAEASR